MSIQFYCYPKCTTCQKAKAWLDQNGIGYESHNLKETPMPYERLQEAYAKSGLPLKKLFNTSGNAYKDLGLKDKLPTMSEEQQLRLLATDGMLVKRPLVLGSTFALVGFKPDEWQPVLQGRLK